jgi:hypothetical protein
LKAYNPDSFLLHHLLAHQAIAELLEEDPLLFIFVQEKDLVEQVFFLYQF